MNIESVQRRLTDGITAVVRARAFYFDPPEFRRQINSAIQALRTVTWVMIKCCDKEPTFKDWYAIKQKEMRVDLRMRWLVDSRNHVEKQGDLDAHSTARATIYRGWESANFTEVKLSPESTPSEYAKSLSHVIPSFAKESNCVLKIERRWVDAGAPDQEIIEMLSYCVRKLDDLVHALDDLFPVLKLPELEKAKAALFEDKASYTGCWMKLQNGEIVWPNERPWNVREETIPLAAARYGDHHLVKSGIETFTPLQKFCEEFYRQSLAILRVDKEVLPFAFLIGHDNSLFACGMQMEDRAEKNVVFRKIAEMAKAEKAIYVLIVNEVWTAVDDGSGRHAGDRADRQEALLIQGVSSDEEYFSIVQPFNRVEGKAFVYAEPSVNLNAQPALAPIFEAIMNNRLPITSMHKNYPHSQA